MEAITRPRLYIYRGSVQSLHPLSVWLRTPVTGLARRLLYWPAGSALVRWGLQPLQLLTHWLAITNFSPGETPEVVDLSRHDRNNLKTQRASLSEMLPREASIQYRQIFQQLRVQQLN